MLSVFFYVCVIIISIGIFIFFDISFFKTKDEVITLQKEIKVINNFNYKLSNEIGFKDKEVIKLNDDFKTLASTVKSIKKEVDAIKFYQEHGMSRLSLTEKYLAEEIAAAEKHRRKHRFSFIRKDYEPDGTPVLLFGDVLLDFKFEPVPETCVLIKKKIIE